MKITVKGSELARAVSKVQSVTGKKSTHQAVACVRLDALTNKDLLTISGTDLSQSLSIKIPMVTTVPSRGVMVSAEKFAALSKSLSGAEAVKIATNDAYLLAIGGGKGKFTLSGLNPDEWPGIIAGKSAEPFGVNGGMLAEALRGVCYAADKSDARGLSAVCLQIGADSKITMAASDGARMAFLSMPTESAPTADQRLILSLNSARTIINLFEGSGSVMMESDGSILTLSNETVQYSTLLLATVFPKWEGFIPNGYDHGVEISREVMTNALRGVLLIQDDSPYSVTMTFTTNNVSVKAVSEVGSHEESIEAITERGGITKRRFNAKLVLDWLEQVPTETFKIEMPEVQVGVVRFRAEGAPGYVCIPLAPEGDNT